MERPANLAPASGPTIAAPSARARDAETGRFIETDGQGRSAAEREVIAARRAQVAKLYPDTTPAQIGAKLGWAKETIEKDVAWLAERGIVERQRPGPRRKHPEWKERECANPDCDERFPRDPKNPTQIYHDHPCAMRATRTELVRETARKLRTEWRRRADEEIARLNEAGYLTSRQLAAERRVEESTVSQWISRGLLSADRRVIEGEPHQLIRRDEFKRFNREEWPRIVDRMGLNWPANWGDPACWRWSGRKNRELAAMKGSMLGPPEHRRLDEVEKDKIRERLADQSDRQIALYTGHNRKTVAKIRAEEQAKAAAASQR